MQSLVISLVTALTGGQRSDSGHERVSIIVPATHTHLLDLLAKAFEGREDVEVIVDRRRGDRRAQERPVAVGGGPAERRRPKGGAGGVGNRRGTPKISSPWSPGSSPPPPRGLS